MDVGFLAHNSREIEITKLGSVANGVGQSELC